MNIPNEIKPITRGAHHVGLAVSKLEESATFFVDVLGWSELSRIPDYPAIFVTDGILMITLWQTQSASARQFDRKQNVGLHHLALSIDSSTDLDQIYHRVKESGLSIEFAPELLGNGPAMHMMCFDPSGIRIEFICVPE